MERGVDANSNQPFYRPGQGLTTTSEIRAWGSPQACLDRPLGGAWRELGAPYGRIEFGNK